MKRRFFLGKISFGEIKDWQNWRTMGRVKTQTHNGRTITSPTARRAFSFSTDEATTYVIRHGGKRCMLRIPHEGYLSAGRKSREIAAREYLQMAIAHTLFPGSFPVPLGIMKIKGAAKSGGDLYGSVTEIVRQRSQEYKDYQQGYYVLRPKRGSAPVPSPEVIREKINERRGKPHLAINSKTAERISANTTRHIEFFDREKREAFTRFASAGIVLDMNAVNTTWARNRAVHFEITQIYPAVAMAAARKLGPEKEKEVEAFLAELAKSEKRREKAE